MQRATKAELNAILREVPPDRRRLVRSLRALVLRTIPECDETILWGALSYHRPRIGGRVKGAVCLIEMKHGRVGLGFIHGARLSDPERLLQGTRTAKRSVQIESARDVARPAIAALIRDAAAVEW